MTRDYVAEIRARQAELAALPDQYHQIVALHGHALQICRTVRLGLDGKMQYTYRLSSDCDPDDGWPDLDKTRHVGVVIAATAESDQKACRKFCRELGVVGHALSTAADRNRLLALAKWYDENPEERE